MESDGRHHRVRCRWLWGEEAPSHGTLDGEPPTESVETGERPDSADWNTEVEARLRATEYRIVPRGGVVAATNRAHNLAVQFHSTGVVLHSRERAFGGEPGLLSLQSIGRGDGTESDFMPSEFVLGGCQSNGAIDAEGRCLQRAEADHQGVVEWWENRPEGLEQGFTVKTKPAGTGRLTLVLKLGSMTAEVDSSETAATFVSSAGRRCLYSGLVAIDAMGNELSARMRVSNQVLVIEVDDAAAAMLRRGSPMSTSVRPRV